MRLIAAVSPNCLHHGLRFCQALTSSHRARSVTIKPINSRWSTFVINCESITWLMALYSSRETNSRLPQI